MKKMIFGIILIAVIAVFVYPAYDNPYAGKYVYGKNNSIYLVLKGNNKFELYESLYKDAEYDYGSYNVKDNVIELCFKNGNIIYPQGSTITGKVEGERITFYNVGEFNRVN